MERKNRFLLFFCVTALLGGACGHPVARLPKVSGHRGAERIAPENTLASADSCIKYGIDYMECDVCISKDSVFYLLHDSTLDRTTNGKGPISEWLSADIDTLDAGFWFGEGFEGIRVPRLAEILRRGKERGLGVTIDYRSGDFGKLLELVRAEGMFDRCTFTFYKEAEAAAFREFAPEVKNLQAYVNNEADLERVMIRVKPDIAVIRIDSLNPRLVKSCHAKGIRVLALALGTPDMDMANRKAIDLGVDILATDCPEEFVRKYKD